ncbi:MAG: hypothetical protein WKG01_14980 [Kofleriaceae bacterium]
MRALVLCLLAGCGLGDLDGPNTDGGNDAGDPQCNVFITFEQPVPPAGPDAIIRAIGNVENGPGVLTYLWRVVDDSGAEITTTPQQVGEITFLAATPGVYDVTLDVEGSIRFCNQGFAPLTVMAPNANMAQYRLRVSPPISQQVPPLDKRITVYGGGNADLGAVVLDPGIVASGNVGGEAYLKFSPAASKDAFVEAFASASGELNVHLIDQPHDVIVVPSSTALAPRKFVDWLPGDPLPLDGGTVVTGKVLAPGGGDLAGAKVQLVIDDLPSTLATTTATGTFSLRAVPTAGATIRVDVTPPAASGLPRLVASSTTFDLGVAFDIRYAALATRDLATTLIRRGGTPIANAKVSIVGTLPSAGTVVAGGSTTATGEVRVLTKANASGRLPTVRAPARVLAAVVEANPGDLAVRPLDLSAGVPTAIDAPAMLGFSTVLRRTPAVALRAQLDAIPIGRSRRPTRRPCGRCGRWRHCHRQPREWWPLRSTVLGSGCARPLARQIATGPSATSRRPTRCRSRSSCPAASRCSARRNRSRTRRSGAVCDAPASSGSTAGRDRRRRGRRLHARRPGSGDRID